MRVAFPCLRHHGKSGSLARKKASPSVHHLQPIEESLPTPLFKRVVVDDGGTLYELGRFSDRKTSLIFLKGNKFSGSCTQYRHNYELVVRRCCIIVFDLPKLLVHNPQPDRRKRNIFRNSQYLQNLLQHNCSLFRRSPFTNNRNRHGITSCGNVRHQRFADFYNKAGLRYHCGTMRLVSHACIRGQGEIQASLVSWNGILVHDPVSDDTCPVKNTTFSPRLTSVSEIQCSTIPAGYLEKEEPL